MHENKQSQYTKRTQPTQTLFTYFELHGVAPPGC
jgi:hypothetical protein